MRRNNVQNTALNAICASPSNLSLSSFIYCHTETTEITEIIIPLECMGFHTDLTDLTDFQFSSDDSHYSDCFVREQRFIFFRRISKARFQKFFKTNRNLSSDKTFAFSEYSSHLGIAQMNLALLSLLEYFCDFREFCVRLSYYSLD